MNYEHRAWAKNNTTGSYELCATIFPEGPVAYPFVMTLRLIGADDWEYRISTPKASRPEPARIFKAGNLDEAKEIAEWKYADYLDGLMRELHNAWTLYHTASGREPQNWERINADERGWADTFECPWCKCRITLNTGIPDSEQPDYEYCPHCGKPVG